MIIYKGEKSKLKWRKKMFCSKKQKKVEKKTLILYVVKFTVLSNANTFRSKTFDLLMEESRQLVDVPCLRRSTSISVAVLWEDRWRWSHIPAAKLTKWWMLSVNYLSAGGPVRLLLSSVGFLVSDLLLYIHWRSCMPVSIKKTSNGDYFCDLSFQTRLRGVLTWWGVSSLDCNSPSMSWQTILKVGLSVGSKLQQRVISWYLGWQNVF